MTFLPWSIPGSFVHEVEPTTWAGQLTLSSMRALYSMGNHNATVTGSCRAVSTPFGALGLCSDAEVESRAMRSTERVILKNMRFLNLLRRALG